ncbi:MAG: YqeG family HAD IIIA-type phosphatase [Firmicutes bacterium]|nr:YqeG family HAD IIIA-type phosphatase [Bacillota bacterium]
MRCVRILADSDSLPHKCYNIPRRNLGGLTVLRALCPDEAHGRLVDIDLERLVQRGIRALILDLDNTLVKWHEAEIPPEVDRWVGEAKAKGFKLCIASNALPDRVRLIAGRLGIPYVSGALKPRRTPFRKAMMRMDADSGETAVVGDQIFTDVLGGKRLGLYTILTRPLSRKEFPTTRILRGLENWVIGKLIEEGYISDWR